jgi:hypothetical protein
LKATTRLPNRKRLREVGRAAGRVAIESSPIRVRSSKTKDRPTPKPVSSSRRDAFNAPEEDGQRSAEFEVCHSESARRGADGVDSQDIEDGALDGPERERERATPGRDEVAG